MSLLGQELQRMPAKVSTARKMALGVTLAGVLGLVVYEAYQNAVLRNQNAALRQGSEASVEHLEALQVEHENTTNMLARVSEENRRLQRDSAELLRLRDEVTRLHNTMQQMQPGGPGTLEPVARSEASALASLDEEQKKLLQEMTHGLQTGNSVSDINRLKDSLSRWDELFMDPSPEKNKPVLAILKGRVKTRIAQLEEERQQSSP
jgi:hypothetical protein